MDEVEDENLFKLGGGDSVNDTGLPTGIEAAYDAFLAELVFSVNDVRIDIMDNYEKASDPNFITWLGGRVDSSTDPEEKMALRSLLESIEETVRMVSLKEMTEKREAEEKAAAEEVEMARREKEMEEGRGMSNADVLRKASKVDTAGIEVDRAASGGAKESFLDSELTQEIRISYAPLLEKILPPYGPGETAAMAVKKNYEMCDAQLIKVLVEKKGDGSGAEECLEEIGKLQEQKMAEATEKLKTVLATGSPELMEGEILKLSKENKIDEAFLLLLEANMNMAKEAGAHGPAEVMARLKKKAEMEKDKGASAPELRLLRQLIREPDGAERERLLDDAFQPKQVVIVPGNMENAEKALTGEQPEQEQAQPDVPPPAFISACKAVLLNFGNVASDSNDMMEKIQQIASEAEIVATRIYGKGMSPREQQDKAFKETTTSIFDLEQMELQAMSNGEEVPWSSGKDDDEEMLGSLFDKDGKMRIGGG